MLTRRTIMQGTLGCAALSRLLGAATARAATKPVRLPLDAFLKDARLLQALRKGVAAMKQRKPSDPLSWFFQASIHGVTDQMVAQAAQTDPGVAQVNKDKYWNQCPHHGQNSANFLPWHRAYTHHFEEILRLHTELEDFAVPYWNYGDPANRTFPREFGVQHLDGNTGNNDPANINPLFHPDRDYFLCGYEHPFTDQLPLSDLSPRAVDASRVMASPVFFGETEATGVGGGIADDDPNTRGLLEQSPHDQIHRVVGGEVVGTDGNGNPTIAIGAMAIPMTAAFDPIFPVHHANIDRLWKEWSTIPGKTWGKLPDRDWFEAKPWFFFDTQGREVNRARKDYFDYQALDVSFADDDPNRPPLQLPPSVTGPAVTVAMQMAEPMIEMVASQTLNLSSPIEVDAKTPTAVALAPASADQRLVLENFDAGMKETKPAAGSLTVTLHGIDIGNLAATGFDVYLATSDTSPDKLTPQGPGYLGAINLFNHAGRFDQSFDATEALASLSRTSLAGLKLVVVPYALATPPKAPGSPIAFQAGTLKATGLSVTQGQSPFASPEQHRH